MADVSEVRHRTVLARAALLLAFIGSAHDVTAQHPLHKLGLGQTMDGALPFEQVDPLSGNLVVTATDLVLPGNAGLDVRVTRVYNSAIYPGYATGDLTIEEDSWAGIGWRLHFGRVLNPASTDSGETMIEMGDGSRHPLYTTTAFPQGWITRGFWLYDRATHTLKMPNGIVYVFGREVTINPNVGVVRYVTEIRDPFNNTITFEYFDSNGPPDGVSRIVQDLGGGQVREVTFTYDSTLKAIATMQFGTKTWHYDQEAAGPAGHSVLRFVRPPVGLPWEYQYSTAAPGHELTTVKAPLGGTVTYTYADQDHRTAAVTTRTRVVSTRVVGGRDVTPGTWTFSYDLGATQSETHVVSPCSTTKYKFGGHGPSGTFDPWLAGTLAERVLEAGGQELEREVFTYQQSEQVSPDFVPGDEGIASSNGVYNGLLLTRVITRERRVGRRPTATGQDSAHSTITANPGRFTNRRAPTSIEPPSARLTTHSRRTSAAGWPRNPSPYARLLIRRQVLSRRVGHTWRRQVSLGPVRE